jgi:hypothetical protein
MDGGTPSIRFPAAIQSSNRRQPSLIHRRTGRDIRQLAPIID